MGAIFFCVSIGMMYLSYKYSTGVFVEMYLLGLNYSASFSIRKSLFVARNGSK